MAKSTSLSAGSISRYFAGSSQLGGSSNFSVMCERASVALRKHASVPCRPCKGLGYRELSVDELLKANRRIAAEKDPVELEKLRESLCRSSTCYVCRGSGYVTAKIADLTLLMDSMFTTVRCSKCRSTGTDRKRSLRARLILGDHCDRCGGAAYLTPVSVKEKGSSKHGKAPKREESDGDEVSGIHDVAPSWVDEDALAERGRVSRVLDALRRADPEAARDLETYNGPDGDKWGQQKWGRRFSLWQHTDAGRALAEAGAKRSKGGHGYLLPALDLIASEREAEERAPGENQRRRQLVAQADKQARERESRMHAALRAVEEAA